jgi:hypothetical protein
MYMEEEEKSNFSLLFAFLVSGWLMLGVGFGLAGRAQRERTLETIRSPADGPLWLISNGQSPNL